MYIVNCIPTYYLLISFFLFIAKLFLYTMFNILSCATSTYDNCEILDEKPNQYAFGKFGSFTYRLHSTQVAESFYIFTCLYVYRCYYQMFYMFIAMLVAASFCDTSCTLYIVQCTYYCQFFDIMVAHLLPALKVSGSIPAACKSPSPKLRIGAASAGDTHSLARRTTPYSQ